jgi:hypothetical protein
VYCDSYNVSKLFIGCEGLDEAQTDFKMALKEIDIRNPQNRIQTKRIVPDQLAFKTQLSQQTRQGITW